VDQIRKGVAGGHLLNRGKKKRGEEEEIKVRNARKGDTIRSFTKPNHLEDARRNTRKENLRRIEIAIKCAVIAERKKKNMYSPGRREEERTQRGGGKSEVEDCPKRMRKGYALLIQSSLGGSTKRS